MIYYVKENVLIASEISIEDSSFAEISEEDYDKRLMLAQQCREQKWRVRWNYGKFKVY